MKKIYMLLLLLIGGLSMQAIPVKKGIWMTITLADGTTVRAEQKGGEFLRYMQDANGNTYVFDSERSAYIQTNLETVATKAKAKRAKRMKVLNNIKAKRFGHPTAYTGKKKGLIILANYKDVKFKTGHDKALFNRIANEEGYSENGYRGSVADYFKKQSRGKFELDFDVVGPVQLPENMKYYGGDVDGDDQRPAEMARKACELADAEVDFSQYDWDGDGYVDQVFIIYAGSSYTDENKVLKDNVWPHMWDFHSGGVGTLNADGVKVNTYACSSELQSSTMLDGIGAICHEFSHCLGFPDMYDTDGDNYGMSFWDIMDAGSYNGSSFLPPGYTAYERWFCGWLEPTELTEATTVSALKPLENGGNSYIIRNKGNENEYYFLENRQPVGFDKELPAFGLLITHVDYDADAWEENTVNTVASHQRCTVVPPDDDLTAYWDDSETDIWPYQGKDELSNLTTPAATLFNANSNGKKYLNARIFGIKQNDDMTMAFGFEPNDAVPNNDNSVTPTGDWFFKETFDQCAGTGGNDNTWSNQAGSGKFIPDNAGWDTYLASDLKAYGGKKCAKFGTSKVPGDLYSPFFNVSGSTTVSFKAAPWNVEKTTLNVLVVDENGEVKGNASTPGYTLTTEHWTNITFKFTYTGKVRLKIWPNTNKRFFLDEVLVDGEETTGVTLPTASSKKRHAVYNLQGVYMGTSLDNLPSGIYVIDGKKVVK